MEHNRSAIYQPCREANHRSAAKSADAGTLVGEELDLEAVDRRDRELGSVIRSWAKAIVGVQSELLGPLDAPGMDPTWILQLRGAQLEADVYLFRGPHLDVSAYRPSAPEAGMLVGGEDGPTDARRVQMLDDLAAASLGADLPAWLRPAEF